MINYSLDEQKIGTWVDGSDLYQKTIVYSKKILGSTTQFETELAVIPDISIKNVYGVATIGATAGNVDTLYGTFPVNGMLNYSLGQMFAFFVGTDGDVKLISRFDSNSEFIQDISCTIVYTKTNE